MSLTKHVAAFSKLPEEGHYALCRHMGLCQLLNHEVLFFQGDLGTYFYTVLHGAISLHAEHPYSDPEAKKVEAKKGVSLGKQERSTRPKHLLDSRAESIQRRPERTHHTRRTSLLYMRGPHSVTWPFAIMRLDHAHVCRRKYNAHHGHSRRL